MFQQLIVFALLGTSIDLVTHAAEAAEEDFSSGDDCRLWLAPSYLTTEDKPVLGLYAGSQGFAVDEIIPSYEIAIPVFDFVKSPAAQKLDLNRRVIEYVESNLWVADYAGSKFEGNSSTNVFIPGIGALPNYHAGLSNVDWLQGSILLREPDELLLALRGRPHPSRGAITPYYNATIRATKAIQPGMELFANFGDTYDENEVDLYNDKVSRWDYEKADKVLDRILEFMDSRGSEMSDTLKDDVLDFMLDTVLEGAGGKHAKVIRSLIPAHPGKLQRVKDAGGTFAYRNRDIVKTMEWLNEHGQCVDNLRAGRSTIEDAGRGAFAKRAIEEGATISPVPMLAIAHEYVLELYGETKAVVGRNNITEYVLDETKPPTGHHLLLNYCFGHPESNLMLLPLAPMVNLINHAPDKTKINAFLQWSKHDDVANDHSLHDIPIARWMIKQMPPIVLELVAIRDILEGEEILIDYGDEWAEAWRVYKEDWTAKTYANGEENAKWPLKALDLRLYYKHKPFPVDIQQGQAPYPPGVLTACFVQNVADFPDGQPRKNAAGQKLVRWLSPATFEQYEGQNLAICDLIDRKVVSGDAGAISYNYTVITRDAQEKWTDALLEVRDVPHEAITLVDRPYSSDIHAPGAFRRWINFDDQRFPQAWRNVRN